MADGMDDEEGPFGQQTANHFSIRTELATSAIVLQLELAYKAS